VNWKSYSQGLVGEFPCGMSLFITSATPALTSWAVRFGTAQIHRKFSDVEEAKQAGILLARDVLVDCLKHLVDDPAFNDPGFIEFCKAKASGN